MNLAGELLCQITISTAGSGVFVVLYSSVTIFAAVFKWRLLGVPLSAMQWVSLFVITVGLAISALNSFTKGD